jgi:hypothetical protein
VFAFGHWRGVPDISATLAIAWPATAIGCLAAALPVTPILRLVVMAALCGIVGCSFDLLFSGHDAAYTKSDFVASCLGVALVLSVVAWFALRQRYDPDRSWSVSVRGVIGGLVLVAVTLTVSGLLSVSQYDGLRNVQRAYPRPALRDGQVVLARRLDVRGGWQWQPCDAEHRAVGVPLADADANVDMRWPGMPWKLEIEAPRWGGSGRMTWFRNGGSLLLDGDGHAWVFDHEARSVRRTGVGDAVTPLPPRSDMERVTIVGAGPGVQRTLIGNRDTGGLWQLDEDRERLEPVPLPDGDRFTSFADDRRERIRGDAELLPLIESLFEPEDRVDYVRGANRTYVRHANGWRAVDVAESLRRSDRPEAERSGSDMLVFTVTVPASGDRAAFRHDYAPRTGEELWLASWPMAASLARPPVLQLTSLLFGAPDGPSTAWNDPLIAGGKRWFLFVLCLGTGALAGFAVARVLRRRGADAATRRFWVVAALCTGPVGAFIAILCEPARAHAQRRAPSAPPAPRILSPVTVESTR